MNRTYKLELISHPVFTPEGSTELHSCGEPLKTSFQFSCAPSDAGKLLQLLGTAVTHCNLQEVPQPEMSLMNPSWILEPPSMPSLAELAMSQKLRVDQMTFLRHNVALVQEVYEVARRAGVNECGTTNMIAIALGYALIRMQADHLREEFKKPLMFVIPKDPGTFAEQAAAVTADALADWHEAPEVKLTKAEAKLFGTCEHGIQLGQPCEGCRMLNR